MGITALTLEPQSTKKSGITGKYEQTNTIKTKTLEKETLHNFPVETFKRPKITGP
jgi:hypothetical protein